MFLIAAACGAHGCADARIQIAGFNLGVLMCALIGQGTPREAAEARAAFIFVFQTDACLAFGLVAVIDGQPAALDVTIGPAPTAK